MSKKKETGTAVATTMTDEDRRRILAMSGQVISGSNNFIPKVKVNKVPVDEETGEDLPVGVVCYMSKAHEKMVYAKRKETVTFTPFAHRKRYEAYDSAANNGKGGITGRSILFVNWNEDIVASNGRLKAGKNDDSLPETVAVKCKHVFFGLISFTGVDAKGEVVVVDNEPVFVQIGGKAFIEYGDMMKEMEGKILCTYDMELSAVHRGEGIYTMELKFIDVTNPSEFSPEKMEALETFSEYINAENLMISKKFDSITKKYNDDGPDLEDGSGDLADDLQDVEDVEYEEVA
jgi:hypothetical protein